MLRRNILIGLLIVLGLCCLIASLFEAPYKKATPKVLAEYRLKSIHDAIRMFMYDNHQEIPQDLTELVPQYIADEQIIISPVTGEYFGYYSYATLTSIPNSIVAYTPLNATSKSATSTFLVLRMDGEIEIIDESIFNEEVGVTVLQQNTDRQSNRSKPSEENK